MFLNAIVFIRICIILKNSLKLFLNSHVLNSTLLQRVCASSVYLMLNVMFLSRILCNAGKHGVNAAVH